MPKNVKCKNCNNLRNHWCETIIDSPDEEHERDCQYFWQKTNADRIRAMTDEELAKFMCEWCNCDIGYCPGVSLCTPSLGKANGLVKWLQQPAEEKE